MSPKTIAALLVCAALAWHNRPHHGVPFVEPASVAARSAAATSDRAFESLFFADQPLASLTESGAYTVVEVYINTCAICKRIERQLPQFLAQRDDVVVRRVHFPENGMGWPADQEAVLGARLESYQICGTPHIEIYKPDGTLLARDECGHKDGLGFLEAWLARTAAAG